MLFKDHAPAFTLHSHTDTPHSLPSWNKIVHTIEPICLTKSVTFVSAPGWAWIVQDCDGINEEEEIEREGDEKRLEGGAAGAAATAAVLVRGQILSTCCTMLDVGWMDVGEQNPSSSLPIPHAVSGKIPLPHLSPSVESVSHCQSILDLIHRGQGAKVHY